MKEKQSTVDWANKVIKDDIVPRLRTRFLMKELSESYEDIMKFAIEQLHEQADGIDIGNIELCLEFDKQTKLLTVYAVDKNEPLYDEKRERERLN